MDIKAGYLLKIVTWENDADNYNTVELDGLTEAEVTFYLHLASLFCSHHDYYTLGNEDILITHDPKTWDADDSAYRQKIEEHLSKFTGEKKSMEECMHFIDNVIGYWLDGDRYRVYSDHSVYHYRVYSDHSVYHVPEPIAEVTTKFPSWKSKRHC